MEQDHYDRIDHIWSAELWPKILKCGELLDVEILPPRRCNKQIMRDNTPGNSSDYFKNTVAKELLATLLADLRSRFGSNQLNVAKMLALTPENLIKKPVDDVLQDLDEFTNQFRCFFPGESELLRCEVHVLQAFLRRKSVILYIF